MSELVGFESPVFYIIGHCNYYPPIRSELVWFETSCVLIGHFQIFSTNQERAGLVGKALWSNWSIQIFSTNQEWAGLVWFESPCVLIGHFQIFPTNQERAGLVGKALWYNWSIQIFSTNQEWTGLVWKALCSDWSLQLFSSNQERAGLVWCVQAWRVPEMVGHDGADTFKESLHLPQWLTLSPKNKIDNTIVKF